MKTIHQVLPSTAPGDAVTMQAFAWRALLRQWGFHCEVVAEHVHPGLARHARPLEHASGLLRRADGLALHYSVWSTAWEDALAARRAKLALCYHNVTPGHLLRPFNPTLADLCDSGRAGLRRFRGRCAVAIADSSFNAEELSRARVDPVTVMPLLLNIPSEPEPWRRKRQSPVLLTVGRIAPNKRIEDVIEVFRLYQLDREPAASLVIVGSAEEFGGYQRQLESFARRIGATRVRFTGRVTQAERDDWYRRASVYVCMSIHEGFCAPLVEAMARGVPVVARAAGAVPETVGEAGIVLDGSDLALFAEAVHEVASSEKTRGALRAAAAQRLHELQPEAVAPRLRTALEPLLA